jgi:hypothetical protein
MTCHITFKINALSSQLGLYKGSGVGFFERQFRMPVQVLPIGYYLGNKLLRELMDLFVQHLQ